MKKIAVIGIGYVGLPLARLFSTKYPVIGYDIKTTIFDPLVLPSLVKENKIKNFNKKNKYDAIVLAVNHKQFKSFKYKEKLKKNSVLYDFKIDLKNKNIDGGL